MPGKVEFQGVQELKRTLEELAKAFEMKGSATERIKDMMMRPANDLKQIAESMAPVDTGNLRDSIMAAPTSRHPGAIVWQDGSTADYGGYVEFGTSNMRAQPFMRPAVQAVRSTFGGSVAQDMPGVFEEVASANRWKG